MELSDILTEDAVFFCSDITSKTALLEFLAAKAETLFKQSREMALETLTNREALGSTGLGEGIAIPHGKLVGLRQVSCIFVRLANPIEFEATDDQPVDLVVGMLAPVGAGAEHLKALSRVARALRTESIVEGLRGSEDPGELHAILTAIQTAHKAA